MRKLLLCLVLLFIVFLTPCFAQSKQQDIRRLVEIVTPNTMADTMHPMLQQIGINAPRSFYVTFFSNDIIMEDYYSIVIPLYDRYFSHNDIIEMLRFYQTPTGVKILETMGPMMLEAMPQMMEWSERITPLLMNELTRGVFGPGL